jgi:hypothetical protein
MDALVQHELTHVLLRDGRVPPRCGAVACATANILKCIDTREQEGIRCNTSATPGLSVITPVVLISHDFV